MVNWHSMKATIATKVVGAFGVPAVITYDSDGATANVSVKFDENTIELEPEDGMGSVNILYARCLINREDLPREGAGTTYRELTPEEDTILVSEIPIRGGNTLSSQTFEIKAVDQDKGSLLQLHLRRK